MDSWISLFAPGAGYLARSCRFDETPGSAPLRPQHLTQLALFR